MSILCMSVKMGGVKGVWAGIVKLHLINPHIDGIALLTGFRAFILHLEPYSSVGSLGKVCKSYHINHTRMNQRKPQKTNDGYSKHPNLGAYGHATNYWSG